MYIALESNDAWNYAINIIIYSSVYVQFCNTYVYMHTSMQVALQMCAEQCCECAMN